MTIFVTASSRVTFYGTGADRRISRFRALRETPQLAPMVQCLLAMNAKTAAAADLPIKAKRIKAARPSKRLSEALTRVQSASIRAWAVTPHNLPLFEAWLRQNPRMDSERVACNITVLAMGA